MRAAALLGLAVLGWSCSLHLNAETLGIRTTMAEPAGEPVVGEDFEVSKKAVYVLWGLFPVARPSLQRSLAGQLIDGSAVSGLEVHVRSRFGDLLVTVLTLGAIVPRTVTFSGTVVNPGPGS